MDCYVPSMCRYISNCTSSNNCYSHEMVVSRSHFDSIITGRVCLLTRCCATTTCSSLPFNNSFTTTVNSTTLTNELDSISKSIDFESVFLLVSLIVLACILTFSLFVLLKRYKLHFKKVLPSEPNVNV